MAEITVLGDSELDAVVGGLTSDLRGAEKEHGNDNEVCRYQCGSFEFRSYDDLNVPMCPANCANFNAGFEHCRDAETAR